MPNLPNPGDRRVSLPLGNLSTAYMQDQRSFIASGPNGLGAIPRVFADKKVGLYYTFNKGDLQRVEMQSRAAGAPAERAGYRLATSTYTCERFALAHAVDDESIHDADEVLDPINDGRDFLSQQALLKMEKTFAAACMTTGLWDTDVTGVSGSPSAGQFQYWDETGAAPVDDFATGVETVLTATGKKPNVAYFGFEAWNTFIHSDQVIDRMQASGIASGSRTPVTQAMAAELLGLEKVFVSEAVENTAAEGATPSNAFIVGDRALLAYVNLSPRPRKKQPSAFYCFSHKMHGTGSLGTRMKRWEEDDTGSIVMEVEGAWVFKRTGTDLGYLFDGCSS